MGMDIIARAAATAATATANTAGTNASNALSSANSAGSAASAAQTIANSAATTANAAQTTANAASTAASSATTAANNATTASNAATTASDSATTSANAASTAAAAAQTTANAASTASTAAQTSASNAVTTANSAASSASQALAAAPPADLFTNIGSKTIDASVTLIKSSGYSTLGLGIATYISDSLATAALATAHPRFCQQTANGRYFRLVGDLPDTSISVAQGGAVGGSGTNQQPAIQATVAYACAMSFKWVDFPESAYELWTPIRTTVTSTHAVDGHPICITTNDGLGLRGRPGGTTLNLKNSVGGSKNTITQVVSGVNWGGGSIYVLPGGAWPAGGSINWVAIENLIVDGGVTYNSADRSNVNLCDKGFWVQDITCKRIDMRNCTFKNFGGEIYYAGGASVSSQLVENCTFDGSPQCALNPAALGTFTGINIQAGNSYQACEIIGGLACTLVGGRFYDCYMSTIYGGPDPSYTPGYPFTFTVRQTTKRPPWVTIQGTRFEGASDGLYLGAFIQGNLITVDCPVVLTHGVGHLRDIHVDIEAWCDQRSVFPAVRFSGPATTTTQMPGAPVGAFFTPPSNIRVNVWCKRTALAQSNSRYINAGLTIFAGLVDKDTITVNVSGDAHQVYSVSGVPPAGFAVPRIESSQFRTTGQPYGGTYDTPASDKVYDILWPAIALRPSAGTWNVTLGTTYGYSDGQKVIFYHAIAGTGRNIVFPAAGAGLMLLKDRQLYAYGDLLELRFDGLLNKWVEERYKTATQQVFTGSATYDAPSIAAGGTTTTTVTATGASLGDLVTGISLNISSAGLVISGYVSAANTVTVVLFNPTGAAVNLAAAALAVTVQKK